MEEKETIFEIRHSDFDCFKVKVRKGKVVWCSDQSHPHGADWESLKTFYGSRPYEVEIKEVKE